MSRLVKRPPALSKAILDLPHDLRDLILQKVFTSMEDARILFRLQVLSKGTKGALEATKASVESLHVTLTCLAVDWPPGEIYHSRRIPASLDAFVRSFPSVQNLRFTIVYLDRRRSLPQYIQAPEFAGWLSLWQGSLRALSLEVDRPGDIGNPEDDFLCNILLHLKLSPTKQMLWDVVLASRIEAVSFWNLQRLGVHDSSFQLFKAFLSGPMMKHARWGGELRDLSGDIEQLCDPLFAGPPTDAWPTLETLSLVISTWNSYNLPAALPGFETFCPKLKRLEIRVWGLDYVGEYEDWVARVMLAHADAGEPFELTISRDSIMRPPAYTARRWLRQAPGLFCLVVSGVALALA